MLRLTYKQMQMQMRSYTVFTQHKYQEFRAKGAGMPDPEPLALRDATEAEVGRIKGEALLLAGRADAARNALIAPYVRGYSDPQLLAALGLSELATGQEDRARKFLEAAAKAKALRSRAYLELARLRFAEAQARPAGAEGGLSAVQVAAVLEPLFVAREQPPPMPEVYQLIAETWTKSEVAPTAEHLAVLGEGLVLFPKNPELVYQTAALYAQRGFTADATVLIEHGLKAAADPADKTRFEQLQVSLAASPPASTASPSSVTVTDSPPP